MSNNRARGWTWTLNNPTEEQVEWFASLDEDWITEQKIKYMIIGSEVGEQGTPHLQGYTYFTTQRTMGGVKKVFFDEMHLEISRGTARDNQRYCSKEGNVICEVGVMPQQGKREDLDEIKRRIKKGETMKELIEVVSNYQGLRMAETLMKYQGMKKREPPIVKWYYGPTGTGKTRSAIAEAEEIGGDDIWISGGSLRWWQGYCGQKCVIIDDFRADFCKYHELLRYLDRHPIQVEYKGGSCWLNATHIWITSAFAPENTYHNRGGDSVKPLLRRISQTQKFGNDEIEEMFEPDA